MCVCCIVLCVHVTTTCVCVVLRRVLCAWGKHVRPPACRAALSTPHSKTNTRCRPLATHTHTRARAHPLHRLLGEVQLQRQLLGAGATPLLGTFLENHDFPRFLTLQRDVTLYKNALTWLLLAEGIPVVYYGAAAGLAGGMDDNSNRRCVCVCGGGWCMRMGACMDVPCMAAVPFAAAAAAASAVQCPCGNKTLTQRVAPLNPVCAPHTHCAMNMRTHLP
jgi:hypothetical protein